MELLAFCDAIDAARKIADEDYGRWVMGRMVPDKPPIVPMLSTRVVREHLLRKGSFVRSYDETAACPKCGFGCITDKHVPARDSWDLQESIRRSCVRCGFAWREAPLNPAPPLTPEQVAEMFTPPPQPRTNTPPDRETTGSVGWLRRRGR